jgi:hypothetical protein
VVGFSIAFLRFIFPFSLMVHLRGFSVAHVVYDRGSFVSTIVCGCYGGFK